jgi:Cas6b C-terminal domain/Cas6b N-terminal domain
MNKPAPLMKKLRLLAVSFDTEIKPWEIARFRGAVAQKVGLEHEWFHNHDNAEGGFHHRYPLIQYKIDTHGRQMRPMMLCLDDCIEEAHHLFSQADWTLRIGGTRHDLRIARLHVDQINLNVWEQPFTYRLHKWRALNSENFREWQQLRGQAEKFDFLDNLLASHIFSFARGVGWTPDRRFEVKITQRLKEEWVSFKGIKMLAFTVEFTANVSLPDYIGLGAGVSEGFGVVRRQGGGRQSEVRSHQSNIGED